MLLPYKRIIGYGDGGLNNASVCCLGSTANLGCCTLGLGWLPHRSDRKQYVTLVDRPHRLAFGGHLCGLRVLRVLRSTESFHQTPPEIPTFLKIFRYNLVLW